MTGLITGLSSLFGGCLRTTEVYIYARDGTIVTDRDAMSGTFVSDCQDGFLIRTQETDLPLVVSKNKH